LRSQGGIDNALDEHHQQTTSWESTQGDCETLANGYWPLLWSFEIAGPSGGPKIM
jgi:hypothetical protein